MTRQQLVNCSTATQTVFDAFWPLGMYPDDMDAGNLALALRAVADQVVPEESLYGGDQRWMFERDARQACRKKLLAIADELEQLDD
jgi:hypothetical protein